MKRAITMCLALALSTAFMIGCAEKTEVKKQTTTSTPSGTTTQTDTKEIKTTGDNPPAPK